MTARLKQNDSGMLYDVVIKSTLPGLPSNRVQLASQKDSVKVPIKITNIPSTFEQSDIKQMQLI